MSDKPRWLNLWEFARKIAPHQAGEAWDWLTWRHMDATPEEFAKAEATVIRENHVWLYAEKTNLGAPLPWERNQLIREQVHRDRTLHKVRVELAITTALPRKIHDRLRAGGYEVMADDQAGGRASLGADILAALTPDLLKRQLVGSGGVVYNNVVIRQLEAADPSLPVPSPAETTRPGQSG